MVERTAPGFAGGSWGSARQGEMVTMPPEVFDRNRADYRLVDIEQLLRDDVAREAREDLDRIERDDDPDGAMDSLLL